METPASSPKSRPVALLWRVLETVRDLLMRLRARLDGASGMYAAVRRMRFSLLFALAAGVALFTSQGQEILVNSFSEPLRGAMFVASCLLTAISVWYTSRLLFYTWKPDRQRGERASVWQQRMVKWLPRVLGASVMLIPAIAIWPLASRMPTSMVAAARVSSVLLISLSFFFLVALSQRRRTLRHAMLSTGLSYAQLSPWTTRFFNAMLILNAIAFVVFASVPLWPLHVGVGPGVVVMLAAGLAIVTGSLLAHLADETRVPLLAGLLVAATVFSLWNDNHEIHLVEPEAGKDPPPLRTLDDYLEQKLGAHVEARERACEQSSNCTSDCATTPGCPPQIPYVVVAAEGGGVRAAAWTALVLSQVDRSLAETPGAAPFSERLVAISGVSGGSLGGALYLATVRESREDLWPRQRRFFQTDLLTPMLGNMLFVDTPQRFFPYPFGRGWVPDRGRTFEHAMEAAWGRATGKPAEETPFARPFEALWAGKHATLPLLLANTTVVGTGERLVQAPVLLNPAAISIPLLRKQVAVAAEAEPQRDSTFRTEPEQPTPLQREIVRRDGAFLGAYDGQGCLLPSEDKRSTVKRYSTTLSGVVHNSARFTWFSPAGRYGEESACAGVRVVDGGYFENSGTATADDVVRAMRARFGDHVRPVVVQIRNDPISSESVKLGCGGYAPMARPGRDASGPMILGEVFDPAIALYKGREARGDQSKLSMKRRICDEGGLFVEFSLTREADESVKFPLHWTIADDTLDSMQAQFERNGNPNRKALRLLVDALSPQATGSVQDAKAR